MTDAEDWWSEKWAQRRADWMNYKEEEQKNDSSVEHVRERHG